jgi:rubrerythrin
MIMQETNTSIAENEKKAALREASRALQLVTTRTSLTSIVRQIWVCDVCGMVFPTTVPFACHSCGARTFTRQTESRVEIGTRW